MFSLTFVFNRCLRDWQTQLLLFIERKTWRCNKWQMIFLQLWFWNSLSQFVSATINNRQFYGYQVSMCLSWLLRDYHGTESTHYFDTSLAEKFNISRMRNTSLVRTFLKFNDLFTWYQKVMEGRGRDIVTWRLFLFILMVLPCCRRTTSSWNCR